MEVDRLGTHEDHRIEMRLESLQRIEQGGSEGISVSITGKVPSSISVVADPYNVIPETDETNNEAVLGTGAAGPTPGKP